VRRFRAFAPLVLLVLASPGAATDYVGAETCKSCHAVAYDIWRISAHARATSNLPEQHQKDARCITCHAPEMDKGLAAVSCESCHGPGQLYSPTYVMRDKELARAVGLLDPTEKQCLGCHTETSPSLARFDFAAKVKLMEHGAADKAARNAPKPRKIITKNPGFHETLTRLMSSPQESKPREGG
jgi:hypothetical protein